MSTSVNRFEGIYEKLKRSRENIANLKREIDLLFEKSGHAVLPQRDMQLLLKAAQDLEKFPVPVRISVLIGEIIHHLRSCLDHIVWQFSSSAYRSGKQRFYIEFPVFESRPVDKESLARYKRKIQGIAEDSVVRAIEGLQPYHSETPHLEPIWLIHYMDITDKHRELVLCVSTAGIQIPPEIFQDSLIRYQKGILTEAEWKEHLKENAEFIPTVSFRDSGKGEPRAVMPLLSELHNFVAKITVSFARKLPRAS